MKIVNILRNKKIKVTEIQKRGIFLRKNWEDNFANHISLKEKEEIYLHDSKDYCGYLWHLFSHEKRDCLKGKEAEKVFNNEYKNNCYIFYQHIDDAFMVENAEVLNTSDLKDEFDIYIVDKEFSWTYVKTHETGYCGPYFSRRNIKK